MCSRFAVASTTMLVPLKLESKKSTSETVDSPTSALKPMSLSSINGQQVLVLDEVTASKLKQANNPVPILLDPLGESSKQPKPEIDPPGKNHPSLPEILFYDPRDGEKPKKVFNKEGKVIQVELDKHDVLIVPPKEYGQIDGSSSEVDSISTTNTTKSSLSNENSPVSSTKRKASSQSSSGETEAEYQAHDQMIIISTVATMAIFVGALSARKLRARQFLNSCIENEALEDEIAYDAAYTTEEAGSYNTFGTHYRGGDLRWRGDLEKFDV